MSHGPLFDVHARTAHRRAEADATHDERFGRFHAAHPEVYVQLVELARKAKARGVGQWGMKGLFEVLRWSRRVERDDREPFRLNNSYASRYARLVIDREADLAGFFETRKLTT